MTFFEMAMKDKGMNVPEVSRLSGVPQSTLYDFKSGKRKPRPDSLQAIADALGVSVEYLLNGSTEPTHYEDPLTAELAERLKYDHELRLLFSAAKDATPETLSITYALLKTLKEREKAVTW